MHFLRRPRVLKAGWLHEQRDARGRWIETYAFYGTLQPNPDGTAYGRSMADLGTFGPRTELTGSLRSVHDSFPALESGHDRIEATLFRPHPGKEAQARKIFDRIEGHPHLFRRQQVMTRDGQRVWVYKWGGLGRTQAVTARNEAGALSWNKHHEARRLAETPDPDPIYDPDHPEWEEGPDGMWYRVGKAETAGQQAWENAWRTELRGWHGRWVESAHGSELELSHDNDPTPGRTWHVTPSSLTDHLESAGATPAQARYHARRILREAHRALARDAWNRLDEQIVSVQADPTSDEAQELMAQQQAAARQMYGHDTDPGRVRDLIVIGGGPAGLNAASHAASEGMDTTLLEARKRIGGQASLSTRIHNSPLSLLGSSGAELMTQARQIALRHGADIQLGAPVEGLKIDPRTHIKTVQLADGRRLRARAVLLATGKVPRNLDIPGSYGHGVTYSDAASLRDLVAGQPVVIVGGANSAAQAAMYLKRSASKVYLVARSGLGRMSAVELRRLAGQPNIHVITGAQLQEIERDALGHVTGVTLSDGQRLPAAGVGLFIGAQPDVGWAGVGLAPNGEVADADFTTSLPGVFVAGDVRAANTSKFMDVALGEGSAAIGRIHRYLSGLRSKHGLGRAKP